MSDISEQDISKTIEELSKTLSGDVGKRLSINLVVKLKLCQLKKKRGVSTNLSLVRLMQGMTSKLPF